MRCFRVPRLPAPFVPRSSPRGISFLPSSALPGLTSAQFYLDGKPVPCPDASCGLVIRNRQREEIRVRRGAQVEGNPNLVPDERTERATVGGAFALLCGFLFHSSFVSASSFPNCSVIPHQAPIDVRLHSAVSGSMLCAFYLRLVFLSFLPPTPFPVLSGVYTKQLHCHSGGPGNEHSLGRTPAGHTSLRQGECTSCHAEGASC